MKLWTKLGLPLALGMLAAAMNWAATTSKLAPYACVRLASDVEFGEPLRQDMFERVEISGDLLNLPDTFVPWRERSLLYGYPSPRSFTKGDLVLLRDAEPQKNVLPTQPGELPMSISLGSMTVVPEFIQVGQQVSFFVGKEPSRSAETAVSQETRAVARQIGPFRVLAVGNRTTQLGQDRPRDGQTLTIAARMVEDDVLDEQSDQLLASLKGFEGMQVMGVILHTTTHRINRVRPLDRQRS